MKKKIILLSVFGLFMLYPIYPLLHELGHCFMTCLLGGTVNKITLLPPSVIVLPATLPGKKLLIVCLSGTLFPCLLGFLPWKKKLWWFGFLLRGCNVVSCLMCLFVLTFSEIASFSFNEDMIRAASLCQGKGILICLFVIMFFVEAFLFIQYSIFQMENPLGKEEKSLEII